MTKIWGFDYLNTYLHFTRGQKPAELLPEIGICLISCGTLLIFYKPTTDAEVSKSEMNIHMKLNHIKDTLKQFQMTKYFYMHPPFIFF